MSVKNKNTVDEMKCAIQIKKMIKNNKINRFASELSHTEDEERKKDINSIMNLLQGITEETKEIDTKNKMNEMYKDIDDFTLKKSWTKLTKDQKKNRIQNYFLNNKENKENDELTLKNILELFTNGKITKKNISYNVKDGEILEISLI